MHQCQVSASILIAENDPSSMDLLKKMLTDCGHQIAGAVETGEEAVLIAEKVKPDLILMGIFLKGGIDGITATSLLKKKLNIPTIYITGGLEDHDFERVKESMPYGFILKPFDYNMLVYCIDLALHRFFTEKNLKEVEQRSLDILTANPDKIFYVNRKGRFLNSREAESAGKNWPDQIARRALPVIERVTASGASEAFEYAVKRKGKIINYEARIIKSKEERALVIIRDVSIRKKAEKELSLYRENLEKKVEGRTRELTQFNQGLSDEISRREETESELRIFRHAMNQSPCLVIIFNAGGEVEFVNQKFIEISGYEYNELIGQKMSQPGNRIFPEPEMWNKMISSPAWKGEVSSLNAQGELYYSLGTLSSITDENESIVKYIFLSEDITEKKKQDVEIDRVRELMEKSKIDEVDIEMDWRDWQDKMMNRNISRTDKSLFRNINNSFTQGAGFGALISLLGMMKSTAVQKGTKYELDGGIFDLIDKNVTIAETAFKTFSNLDWIITNDFELVEISFREFYEFCRLVIADAEKFCHLKNHKIILNSFPVESAEQKVLFNREYMYKVIYEALINAQKFSRQRTYITVFVSVVGRYGTLSVINDPEKGEGGIVGIPTEYEKVIFEPFFRLSKLVFEQYYCLDFGLGLTLIEKIISKHGGEVNIRNIVDHSDLRREAQVKVNLTVSIPLALES